MTKNEFKNLILNNITYEEILDTYNIEKYKLLYYYYYLIKSNDLEKDILNRVINEYLDNINFISLEDNNILLISDQHLGSKEENIIYQELAEDFRINNNIDLVFHGGDIGDGMLDYHKNYGTVPQQIDHILETIPKIGGEKYLLAGNHDYRYLRKGYDILSLLEEDETIHGIGYFESYFKVYDKNISFTHNSKLDNSKLLDKDFTISGHSHVFRANNNRVKLPALSDNNPNRNFEDSAPGFVLLKTNKVDNQVVLDFTRYIVNNDNYKKDKTKQYTL